MSTPQRVVIVGGGLAGAKTAEALRAEGFAGQLTLLAAEAHLPYERPPLSKGYLAGTASIDEATVHPQDWYRDNNVDLRLGTRATVIDAGAHQVRLAEGTAIGYDKLVLATGALPHRLTLPGADRTASTTCAPKKTPTRSALVSAAAIGWLSSAAAGSAWKSRPSPAAPAPG